MKNFSFSVLPLLLAVSLPAMSADISYSMRANTITVSANGQSRICQLAHAPRFAVESFDKTALIVSERGYVPVRSLEECNAAVPISISSIPRGVGVLADVNLTKGLYVALDYVNVQPFLYLATVAHLGSSKNLVTLNGAYVPRRKLSEQRRHAFNGSGDAGSAIISPDGRFVAPTAAMNCTDDAYPGVWDISKNEHVLVDAASCSQLFGSK
ncbi:hypothetical protein PQR75_35655 [Paraburkholderia fungorum]|uniref:hypothetical protein n=1 Tax=Paraburkholderia fungorum TaxID=134537 RepID=UPI0038B994F1